MITQFPSKEYDISRLISKSRLPEDYIAYCKKHLQGHYLIM